MTSHPAYLGAVLMRMRADDASDRHLVTGRTARARRRRRSARTS